jgi:Tol biopolymer transport system component
MTATDANGDYTISNLPSDNYIVTPSRGTSSFLNFAPELREVSITTADIIDQDFVANVENSGQITLLSLDLNGNAAAGGAFDPTISADGRYVAFRSGDPNLVPGDTNNRQDIFVRDIELGITTRVSVRSNGQEGTELSSSPSISSNGRYVVFESDSSLVSGGS